MYTKFNQKWLNILTETNLQMSPNIKWGVRPRHPHKKTCRHFCSKNVQALHVFFAVSVITEINFSGIVLCNQCKSNKYSNDCFLEISSWTFITDTGLILMWLRNNDRTLALTHHTYMPYYTALISVWNNCKMSIVKHSS